MLKVGHLDNGICVVGEENNHVRTMSIGIWIKNGSVDEDDSTNGISHFIEHMLFKGTATRTAKDIAEEMAEVGGRINAFTSKEYMCYYAHVLDNHFNVALNVLSDMVCNSIFDEDEIQKEKGVIIEEIKMYEDSPEDIVNDILQAEIWKGTKLANNILGSEENVKSFTREDIVDYMNKHYVSENIVISVVGKMNFEDVVKQLNSKFSGISTNKPVERLNDYKYEKSFITKNKDIEQGHICLTFPCIPYDSDEIYTLNVLNTILGGGLNSRLFQSIREEKGLVYSIYSYPESYKDGGIFSIYAATNPSLMEEVVLNIKSELDKVLKEGFNEKELIRTKEQIKSNLIIGLENMNSRMSNYGKSKLVLNRIKSQDEIITKLNGVNVEALTEFTKKIIDYNNLSVSIVGKIDEINIERIKDICKS